MTFSDDLADEDALLGAATPEDPMTEEGFEDALARALHGEVLTDAGASPAMLEALLRVAAASSAADRRVAARAARALREREHPTEYRDPDFLP